jgi:hypothetical protein
MFDDDDLCRRQEHIQYIWTGREAEEDALKAQAIGGEHREPELSCKSTARCLLLAFFSVGPYLLPELCERASRACLACPWDERRRCPLRSTSFLRLRYRRRRRPQVNHLHKLIDFLVNFSSSSTLNTQPVCPMRPPVEIKV